MQSHSRGWLPTPPITPSLESASGFGCPEPQQRRVNGQYIFIKVPKAHHTMPPKCFTVGPFPQVPPRVRIVVVKTRSKIVKEAQLEQENRHLIHRITTLESELQHTTAEVDDYKLRYDMLHKEMRDAAAEITIEQQKWRAALQSSRLAQERQEQECLRIRAEHEVCRQRAKDSEIALRAAEIECSLLKTTTGVTTRIDQMERDLRADIALLRRNLSLANSAD